MPTREQVPNTFKMAIILFLGNYLHHTFNLVDNTVVLKLSLSLHLILFFPHYFCSFCNFLIFLCSCLRMAINFCFMAVSFMEDMAKDAE